MSHSVTLEQSFVRHINSLREAAQDQIYAIIAALEDNVAFEPIDQCYLFERDAEEGICTCRHLTDWDDWRMIWFYKYWPALPSTLRSLAVGLEREPLILETLLPKKKNLG